MHYCPIFALFYFLFEGNKHPKEVTPRGKLTEGFLCYEFEGLIH